MSTLVCHFEVNPLRPRSGYTQPSSAQIRPLCARIWRPPAACHRDSDDSPSIYTSCVL
ncbi:hypothetical protein KSP39_PZI016001 [Platanthera zijinensis]|uniref:Uncharacterized protein n=1 Tax=Platanthera zijinensis TaxID=2320716 RepID=A0AAP0B8H5_9ASPA